MARPNSLSEGLLQGHELTGIKCPHEGCVNPLLALKGSGDYTCPTHGFLGNADVTPPETKAKSKQQDQERESNGESPPRTKEEASESVSKKLLEGWRLTAHPCPAGACGTPLLASQDGSLWCARHEAWVQFEGAQGQVGRKHQQEQQQPSREQSKLSAVRDKDQSEATSTYDPRRQPTMTNELHYNEGEGEEGTSSLVRGKGERGQLESRGSMRREEPRVEEVARMTKGDLLEKMEWARTQLNGCQDIQRVRTIACALNDLANAFSSLSLVSQSSTSSQ